MLRPRRRSLCGLFSVVPVRRSRSLIVACRGRRVMRVLRLGWEVTLGISQHRVDRHPHNIVVTDFSGNKQVQSESPNSFVPQFRNAQKQKATHESMQPLPQHYCRTERISVHNTLSCPAVLSICRRNLFRRVYCFDIFAVINVSLCSNRFLSRNFVVQRR